MRCTIACIWTRKKELDLKFSCTCNNGSFFSIEAKKKDKQLNNKFLDGIRRKQAELFYYCLKLNQFIKFNVPSH